MYVRAFSKLCPFLSNTKIAYKNKTQSINIAHIFKSETHYCRILHMSYIFSVYLGKVVTGAPAKNTYQAIHIPPVRPVKLPLSLLTAHRELNNVAMLAPLQERTDYFELSGSGDDDNGGIPQSKCSQSGTRLVTKRLHSDVIETSGWPKGSEMTADFGDIDSKAASSIARRTTSIPFNCVNKASLRGFCKNNLNESFVRQMGWYYICLLSMIQFKFIFS